MATTFVNVPDLEQQYDLWEAGLLWYSHNGRVGLVSAKSSEKSRAQLIACWRQASYDYPNNLYGYMAED